MLKLRLINGPKEGQQLRVSDTRPVSIGRRQGRLRLHDSRVSKRHAEIAFEDGLWVIRDVGSSNGTYVNHQRVMGVIVLEPDDLIQIGRMIIGVTRADDIGMDLSPIEEKSEAKIDLPEPIGEVPETAFVEPDQVELEIEQVEIETDSAQDSDEVHGDDDHDEDDEDLISLSDEPFDIDAAFDDLAKGLDDTADGR